MPPIPWPQLTSTFQGVLLGRLVSIGTQMPLSFVHLYLNVLIQCHFYTRSNGGSVLPCRVSTQPREQVRLDFGFCLYGRPFTLMQAGSTSQEEGHFFFFTQKHHLLAVALILCLKPSQWVYFPLILEIAPCRQGRIPS